MLPTKDFEVSTINIVNLLFTETLIKPSTPLAVTIAVDYAPCSTTLGLSKGNKASGREALTGYMSKTSRASRSSSSSSMLPSNPGFLVSAKQQIFNFAHKTMIPARFVDMHG